MTTQPEVSASDELNDFIPRPKTGISRRHMLAIDPAAYKKVTAMAEAHNTTRGRIITALLAFYEAE